jgi:hypothetical protein
MGRYQRHNTKTKASIYQLRSNEVHLIASLHAIRPQLITCNELRRSIVDVELQSLVVVVYIMSIQ